jgi:tetraacyldisaccharide 4'-kinase
MYSTQRLALNQDLTIMLVVGIAGTEYQLSYLETERKEVRVMEYNDHYAYSEADIKRNLTSFRFDRGSAKMLLILTTEKDAMRLDVHRQFLLHNKIFPFIFFRSP